jgi:hypothetical protein
MAPPVSMPVTPPVEEPPAFRIPQASEIPGDWDGLHNMALNCRNCALCNARQNVVFGEGAPNARLMFIGEGTGETEDQTGRLLCLRESFLNDYYEIIQKKTHHMTCLFCLMWFIYSRRG